MTVIVALNEKKINTIYTAFEASKSRMAEVVTNWCGIPYAYNC